MANIPLKPWETNNVAYGTNSPVAGSPYLSNNQNRLYSSAIPYPGTGGGSVANTSNALTAASAPQPPPLPPRPQQTRPIYSAYNRSSYMPYNSFNSYGMSSYSYSPYSSFGGYGSYGMYPNRPYGGYPGDDLSFSQLAEESASTAFQSIESFVGAFTSISAMLESTFHALYSSFRAVIGVADHLGRVKQILSTLAIFRFFKWVLRRFLYLIGVSKIKPQDVESLWNNLSTNENGVSEDSLEMLGGAAVTKPSSWPIIMFISFIFAGPYLMWKLIKSLKLDQSKGNRKWASGEEEHFVASVEYNFEPYNDRELQVKAGQMIRLAPARYQPSNVKGWVLASDGTKIGLVPTNYIKVKGKRAQDTRPLLTQHTQSLVDSTYEKPTVHPVMNNYNIQKVNESLSAGNVDRLSDSSAVVSSDDDTDTLVGDPVED